MLDLYLVHYMHELHDYKKSIQAARCTHGSVPLRVHSPNSSQVRKLSCASCAGERGTDRRTRADGWSAGGSMRV